MDHLDLILDTLYDAQLAFEYNIGIGLDMKEYQVKLKQANYLIEKLEALQEGEM
jgi:hypothetical protein